MQVEVSKYTEGVNEKETALGSIVEVVQTVERPRTQTQSSKTEIQEKSIDSPLVGAAEQLSLNTPGRETPLKGELSRTNSWNSSNSKSRKSIRSSLMG